jgi:hypothetical protein
MMRGAAVFLALCLAVAAATDTSVLEMHTKQGAEYASTQQWDNSIAEYRKALELRAQSDDATWTALTESINTLCHALRGKGFIPPADIDKYYQEGNGSATAEDPSPPPTAPPPLMTPSLPLSVR